MNNSRLLDYMIRKLATMVYNMQQDGGRTLTIQEIAKSLNYMLDEMKEYTGKDYR